MYIEGLRICYKYQILWTSLFLWALSREHMSGVSTRVMLKQACSATKTSWKIDISLAASLNMILSKKQITNVLISLCRCAGWSSVQTGLHLCCWQTLKTGFLALRPILLSEQQCEHLHICSCCFIWTTKKQIILCTYSLTSIIGICI